MRFCDSAGRAGAPAAASGADRWALVLSGVAPRLARHLHVAGLPGRFEVRGTTDEAVARVREPYACGRGEPR
ncbi:hypothetical protein FH610_040095 [Microbispora catharanthi]|uniref:Uncharacterized protein n=1 Tax=Microbispora catharanthi TaxID=1712871 RepID=A0A5N6B2X9_9ACTN|nr:hypothetical protein FH610_040095 [Microbispora catharanthi]